MNNPQISVIIPVYKAEKYLCRCVDSILNQTYKDFELILVDDGSPDGCPAICDEYAEKDAPKATSQNHCRLCLCDHADSEFPLLAAFFYRADAGSRRGKPLYLPGKR